MVVLVLAGRDVVADRRGPSDTGRVGPAQGRRDREDGERESSLPAPDGDRQDRRDRGGREVEQVATEAHPGSRSSLMRSYSAGSGLLAVTPSVAATALPELGSRWDR
ncbi:hypothetical protein ADK41_03155 [Streptomyces caelestis]|uniref:Uncharacterized protein n=1 Tax=Streptomyces caelestis TaxID=36816 RepID=A0A0M9XB27_9ACTN|nr:hypothetical protein ADK41_03155 [Streptomyces caelestis]